MTDFLERLTFKFAKTMPSCRTPENEADFVALFNAVREKGVEEKWGGRKYRYWYPVELSPRFGDLPRIIGEAAGLSHRGKRVGAVTFFRQADDLPDGFTVKSASQMCMVRMRSLARLRPGGLRRVRPRLVRAPSGASTRRGLFAWGLDGEPGRDDGGSQPEPGAAPAVAQHAGAAGAQPPIRIV